MSFSIFFDQLDCFVRHAWLGLFFSCKPRKYSYFLRVTIMSFLLTFFRWGQISGPQTPNKQPLFWLLKKVPIFCECQPAQSTKKPSKYSVCSDKKQSQTFQSSPKVLSFVVWWLWNSEFMIKICPFCLFGST